MCYTVKKNHSTVCFLSVGTIILRYFCKKKRFSLPIQFLFVHLHNTKKTYFDANN